MSATEISPPARVSPGSIQPSQLADLLKQGVQVRLLDVRSAAEYDAQHVAGTVHQPLDSLVPARWVEKGVEHGGGQPLYIFCQSGGRAGRAAALLAGEGVACSVVAGGLEAWLAAGLPVEQGESKVLPLMRQVQLVIGLVAGTGAALAVWKHPLFGLIPLFMSAGLVFAGLTGYCGLAVLMARMPWNRRTGGAASQGASGAGVSSCCAQSGGDR
jgi:rhodanese-related sulfurtransferase